MKTKRRHDPVISSILIFKIISGCSKSISTTVSLYNKAPHWTIKRIRARSGASLNERLPGRLFKSESPNSLSRLRVSPGASQTVDWSIHIHIRWRPSRGHCPRATSMGSCSTGRSHARNFKIRIPLQEHISILPWGTCIPSMSGNGSPHRRRRCRRTARHISRILPTRPPSRIYAALAHRCEMRCLTSSWRPGTISKILV